MINDKSKRRPVQFSLLALFLTGLITAIFAAAWNAQRADVERAQQEISRRQRQDNALEEARWIAVVRQNIDSRAFLDRFVDDCRKRGPEAVTTLPALRDLRTRKAPDEDLLVKIDAAIRAVEGTMPGALP